MAVNADAQTLDGTAIEAVVRASSLSQYPDCPRRWAARHLRGDVEAAGHTVRALPSSVGALVGSGTHAAVAHDLTHKMEHGDFGPWDEVEQRGIQEFDDRLGDEGVQWDQVTPTVSDGHQTVARLARTYRAQIGAILTPISVERRLTARHSTGITVSGQSDVTVIAPADLDDLKTGKNQTANQAQYGCYSMLQRSHGQPITGIVEDFARRVPLGKPQPPITRTRYDLSACERQAEVILQRLARDITEFRRTGNREVWLANPNSVLCGEKYCPAHGTNWCPYGRSR